MLTFLCYPKCSTCQKAKKWLDDRGISYRLRDIKLGNPTAEELALWHGKSGLPLRRFFNTSGKGVSHVGIYIGNHQFIHASTYNVGVIINDLDYAYYTTGFVGGRRLLG